MRRLQSRGDVVFIDAYGPFIRRILFPLSLWERVRVRALVRETNQVKVSAASVPLPSPLPKGEGVLNFRGSNRMSCLKLALSLLLFIGLFLASQVSARAACSGGPCVGAGPRLASVDSSRSVLLNALLGDLLGTS